jgi:glycosyltransferase involved in cell wall biosynthesis
MSKNGPVIDTVQKSDSLKKVGSPDSQTSSVPLTHEMEQRLGQAEGLLQEAMNDPPEPSDTSNRQSRREVKSPEVSIVVPVFNEESTVQRVVEGLLQLPLDAEVIVVDDASTDGTGEVLRSLGEQPGLHIISKPINQGKGAAVRTGFRQAVGSIVVVQDADLEYDPAAIPSLVAPIREGRAEVVYGSRFLNQDHGDSLWHRWGNGGLTTLSNWTTGLKLTDMETCQKAFCSQILLGLPLEQPRFGFEPEITARLAQLQARFVEVPIDYQARSYREGKKIGWQDLVSTLYCIFRYGWMR